MLLGSQAQVRGHFHIPVILADPCMDCSVLNTLNYPRQLQSRAAGQALPFSFSLQPTTRKKGLHS